VLRVDPATGAAQVMAGGFRNAYDHCFNAEGELLTYDSDMEWDIGAPWYRAPRIVHVVRGGEYGWRSGSGCWPDWFADSLPPVCETDSASPTGMVSGHESAWPDPWRSMIYAADWTFGRILAVTLSRQGATYSGSWQLFASGRPMPVADLAWGPDGQMYLVTGGRGTRSGLSSINDIPPPHRCAPPRSHCTSYRAAPEGRPRSGCPSLIRSSRRCPARRSPHLGATPRCRGCREARSGVDLGALGAGRYPCAMSQRTQRKKKNARKKKANHGRKPNFGRN